MPNSCRTAHTPGTLFRELLTPPVALSLQDDYAGQFVVGSGSVPVIADSYETQNFDLNYPELLRKCLAVKLEITEENIALVEKDALSVGMLKFLWASGRQDRGLYECY